MVAALLSAISFALMSFLVHCAPLSLPTHQVAFWRGFVGAIALLPWVWRSVPEAFKRSGSILWWRAIAGSISLLSFFYVLRYTQAPTARALSDLSAPIVVLGSLALLKERLKTHELIGIALLLFGGFQLHHGELSNLPSHVTWVGLLGAFAAATAYLSLKRATVRFSNLLVVWFFLSVSCMMSGLYPGEWASPTAEEWILLISIGVSGLLGQIFLTQSYATLPASLAAPLSISGLAWGVGLELTFHDHPMPATLWTAYGLIAAGVVVLGQGNRKRPKTNSADQT